MEDGHLTIGRLARAHLAGPAEAPQELMTRLIIPVPESTACVR
ncbi:hypothetical protein [Nocardia abscessus]|nr:hypothetical protein [Nocardia abscessus]